MTGVLIKNTFFSHITGFVACSAYKNDCEKGNNKTL